MSDKWYFVYLCPEEDGNTYNNDEETVEYTVYFKDLNGSLASFFNRFYDRNNGFDDFCKEELGCIPVCFWDLYSEEDGPKKEEEEKKEGSGSKKSGSKKKEESKKKYDYHYETDKDVTEMFINTIMSERGIFPKENSFLVKDTREFDHEWAFFTKEAVEKGELEKNLSKIVKIKDDNVVCEAQKITMSAYLDDK